MEVVAPASAAPSPDLLVICGPTASGKTRLGVRLALRLGGEVLSADSRQVYRGLDLGSGKDLAEYRTPQGSVACHLVDLVPPQQVYTLWQYQADFAVAVAAVRARGRVPVVVGGTGLYVEAVVRGYQVPAAPPDPQLRARLEGCTTPQLLARLAALDPARAAAVGTASRRRLIRALEAAHGKEAECRPVAPPQASRVQRPLVVGVRWERATLRRRIASRLDERLGQGMVAEVEGLLAGGLAPERLQQLGMEYRHLGSLLAGRLTYEQMRAVLERDIGRLAKRQETYFRGMERRGVPMRWVDGQDTEEAVEQVGRWWDELGGGKGAA